MKRPVYRLRFWGVRGTVPSPAADKLEFGGNTICLSAALGDRDYLILDCGSGLRLLGSQLVGLRNRTSRRYHIFLSHYHFDHVQGLPYFPPLYDPHSIITFHGFRSGRNHKRTKNINESEEKVAEGADFRAGSSNPAFLCVPCVFVSSWFVPTRPAPTQNSAQEVAAARANCGLVRALSSVCFSNEGSRPQFRALPTSAA